MSEHCFLSEEKLQYLTMTYHPALLSAVKDFNSGHYFEAHEHLEEALDDVEDDNNTWEMFVGLIQIAVGYHKYVSGYPGGVKMLGKGLEKVSSLPEECAGVRLESLRQRVRQDLENQKNIRASSPRIQLVRP